MQARMCPADDMYESDLSTELLGPQLPIEIISEQGRMSFYRFH